MLCSAPGRHGAAEPVASTNCATPFHCITHCLPVSHFPCHSAPAKVGQPLVQDPSTDTPILALPGNEDTVGIEPRTCELFAESFTDEAI